MRLLRVRFMTAFIVTIYLVKSFFYCQYTRSLRLTFCWNQSGKVTSAPCCLSSSQLFSNGSLSVNSCSGGVHLLSVQLCNVIPCCSKASRNTNQWMNHLPWYSENKMMSTSLLEWKGAQSICVPDQRFNGGTWVSGLMELCVKILVFVTWDFKSPDELLHSSPLTSWQVTQREQLHCTAFQPYTSLRMFCAPTFTINAMNAPHSKWHWFELKALCCVLKSLRSASQSLPIIPRSKLSISKGARAFRCSSGKHQLWLFLNRTWRRNFFCFSFWKLVKPWFGLVAVGLFPINIAYRLFLGTSPFCFIVLWSTLVFNVL